MTGIVPYLAGALAGFEMGRRPQLASPVLLGICAASAHQEAASPVLGATCLLVGFLFVLLGRRHR